MLDFRKSLDKYKLVHPEDDWSSSIDTGDVKRNLIHHEEDEHGNVGENSVRVRQGLLSTHIV